MPCRVCAVTRDASGKRHVHGDASRVSDRTRARQQQRDQAARVCPHLRVVSATHVLRVGGVRLRRVRLGGNTRESKWGQTLTAVSCLVPPAAVLSRHRHRDRNKRHAKHSCWLRDTIARVAVRDVRRSHGTTCRRTWPSTKSRTWWLYPPPSASMASSSLSESTRTGKSWAAATSAIGAQKAVCSGGGVPLHPKRRRWAPVLRGGEHTSCAEV